MIKLSGFYTPQGVLGFRGAVQSAREPWASAAAAISRAAAARAGRKPNAMQIWYTPGAYQNPAGFNAAMQPFIGDCDTAFVMSLDGYLKDQAAPTAQRIVRAWTTINKGVSTYKGPDGNDSYLSMCTEGNGLVQAAILLDTQTRFGWSAQDAAAARTWVSKYYVPVGKDILGPQHMTNNWADWACFALALSAYYLPDTTLRDYVAYELKAHIIHAIDPATGLLPEEMLRGDKAIGYTGFSLMPMVSACVVLHAAGGPDLLTDPETGPLVKKALDTLLKNINPLKAGQLPPWYDCADLYELAGAVLSNSTYKGQSTPHRPVLTLGHHLSLGTASTMTAVWLPPSVPQRRQMHRRASDVGPLDEGAIVPLTEVAGAPSPVPDDDDEPPVLGGGAHRRRRHHDDG